MRADQWEFDGTQGRIVVQEWSGEAVRWLALLIHGYGEHIGRYEHVADRLVRVGAAVVGPDHVGHGRSEGDRVVIVNFEDIVTDVHEVAQRAHDTYADLPVVLIGHSMGGLIAARYAQHHGDRLSALVLSGPVLHRLAVVDDLLAVDEIPYVPIDPDVLSRDAAVGRAYAEDPLVWHGPFKRPTLEAFQRCMRDIDAGPDLGDLPTLWVHGEEDQLVPIGHSRTGVHNIRGANFRSHTYPDARHEIFNEVNKEQVLDDVVRFLGDCGVPIRP